MRTLAATSNFSPNSLTARTTSSAASCHCRRRALAQAPLYSAARASSCPQRAHTLSSYGEGQAADSACRTRPSTLHTYLTNVLGAWQSTQLPYKVVLRQMVTQLQSVSSSTAVQQKIVVDSLMLKIAGAGQYCSMYTAMSVGDMHLGWPQRQRCLEEIQSGLRVSVAKRR